MVAEHGTGDRETGPRELDAMRLYLEEIGQHALLDRRGEARLGRVVQAGIRASRELAQRATFAEGRRAELVEAERAGRRAAAEFTEANLRLVVSVARRYQHRGVELGDLIQEGNVGLMRAVERFDPDLGFRFSTYATWWIRQAITSSIASSSSTIRLPQHAREKAAALRAAEDRLRQNLGRTPCVEEIAAECGITSEEAQLIRRAEQAPVSLSTPLDDQDQDAELGDLIAGTEPGPELVATSAVQSREVGRMLCHLTTLQADVIRLRYGLDGAEPATLTQVGTALGVSGERARQVETRALARLRRLPELAETA